jgi:putative membrane protein
MMEMTIIQESSLFGSLIRIVLNGLAMFAIAYVLKTVDFKSFKDALLAALIMAVFNVTIAPILEFFTSPIRLITFGLFNIVIDAALLYGVAYLLKGFTIKGFGGALLLAVLLSLANGALHMIYFG